MPSAGLRSRVEGIAGRPLPHGLLGGCADIIDLTEAEMHQLMGVDYPQIGCCPVRDTGWCDDESPGEESPGAGSSPPKTFCRPEYATAAPHTIYAGAECSTMGWSYDEARTQVLASIELGEQRAVEAAFWRDTLAMEAVDLTPDGGAVNMAAGVAALEGCLAETYGGVGVLHVPAGAAALLGCCNVLCVEPGEAPSTMAGNCAVIGAGYSAMNTGPGGIPADPGTAWLYMTGPVQVRRGPIDLLPDRNQSVDIRFNDLRVLAERTYVVSTTCSVCAINVTLCP